MSSNLHKTFRLLSFFRSEVYTVDPVIVEYILKTNFANYVKERKADMVSRFLALNETDPKYLRDIILSFVIAGRDTTASTLSWFFYMLCKHPHVQENIVHEVGDSLTDEALENMHYLHAALSETLRLYPAVPLDGKLCLSDETLPDDAEEFRPELMGKEHTLLISNNRSDIDWLVGCVSAQVIIVFSGLIFPTSVNANLHIHNLGKTTGFAIR